MYTYSIFAIAVGKYGREEISEAVSGMLTVEITENQFGKELQQLSESLVDLLHYLLDTQDEIDLVIAYFVCYNWVLKFEYKGKEVVYTLYYYVKA